MFVPHNLCPRWATIPVRDGLEASVTCTSPAFALAPCSPRRCPPERQARFVYNDLVSEWLMCTHAQTDTHAHNNVITLEESGAVHGINEA